MISLGEGNDISTPLRHISLAEGMIKCGKLPIDFTSKPMWLLGARLISVSLKIDQHNRP